MCGWLLFNDGLVIDDIVGWFALSGVCLAPPKTVTRLNKISYFIFGYA